MGRLAAIVLLATLVVAGPASAPAFAQTTGPAGLGELWERYPLEDEGATPSQPAPATPTDGAAAPAPSTTTLPRPVNVARSAPPADRGGFSEWIPLVVLLVSLLLLGAAIGDHVRSRRRRAAARWVSAGRWPGHSAPARPNQAATPTRTSPPPRQGSGRSPRTRGR